MIMLTFLQLALLSLAAAFTYDPGIAEQALAQRLCLSVGIGEDYFKQVMVRMMDEYVLFFSHPEYFFNATQGYQRYWQAYNKELSHPAMGLNLALSPSGSLADARLVFEQVPDDPASERIRLEYPVQFEEAKKSKVRVSGTINFGLYIQFTKVEEAEGSDGFRRQSWNLTLGAASETEVILDHCSGGEDLCKSIADMLRNSFKADVLLFLRDEVHPYDQPEATRIIQGLMSYLSSFTRRSIQVFHPVLRSEGIHFLFNCKREMAEKIGKMAVAPLSAEISLSQNLFDNLFQPHELTYTVSEVLSDPYIIKNFPASSISTLKSLLPDGQVRFTKDPVSLAALDLSKEQTPGLSNLSQAGSSVHTPGVEMDVIAIRQNLFVEVTEAGKDLTIVPIEFNVFFRALSREGHQMLYGPTQEFKLEFEKLELNIKDSETIDSSLQLHEHGRPFLGSEPELAKITEEPEDEDFEDEEDFEDDGEETGQNEKPAASKISKLGQFITSMRDLAQLRVQDLFPLLEDVVTFRTMPQNQRAHYNEFIPLTHKESQDYELCTGTEALEPSYSVDDDRFVMKMQMNPRIMPNLIYCNTIFKAKIDPRDKHDLSNRLGFPFVSTALLHKEDLMQELGMSQGYITGRIEGLGFPDLRETALSSFNYLMHYFTTYEHYLSKCEEFYTKETPTVGKKLKSPLFYENCVLSNQNHAFRNKLYSGLRDNGEYAPPSAYFSLDNALIAPYYNLIINILSYTLAAFGLLLYFNGVQLPRKALICTILITTVLLSFPLLFVPSNRFGIDYPAYIQQAGAVYHGERNYTQISSSLGACQYPAGHIWHHLPLYWLHLQTVEAEKIIKFGFSLLHAASIVFVFLIADEYYNKPSSSNKEHGSSQRSAPLAQLMALAMLANHRERIAFSDMFNDEIMAIYTFAGIYFTIKQRPFVASLLVTLGLSVKAGTVIFLPPFLGALQYNFGTKVLASSVAIIIGFQIIIALPFLLQTTSLQDYLQYSQLGFQGKKFERRGGYGTSYRAANYKNSIFFRFLDISVYTHPDFPKIIMVTMAAVHVLYFFVKQNCFWKCFSNLLNTFSGAAPSFEKKKTIEILVIGYVTGALFSPGAHYQFIFWIMSLIPFLLTLLPIPYWLTFWLPIVFLPPWLNQTNSETQIFLLIVVGILMFKPTQKEASMPKKVKMS